MSAINKNSVLFVVSGVGLGNSTRCLSVIEVLSSKGIQCDVATFGIGMEFFKDRKLIRELIALEPIRYRKLGIFSLLTLGFQFAKVSFLNELRIFNLVRKNRPTILVYDSIYGILPRIFLDSTILTLNNSNHILREVLKRKNLPRSKWAHFCLVESLDSIFQGIVPNWVLSPWPLPSKQNSRSSKFKSISPIVRNQIKESIKIQKPLRIATVTTGSGLNKDLTRFSEDVADLLKGVVLQKPPPQDELSNNTYFLNQADLIISNGGFSSISEGLKRKVPLIVVPLSGHSEQWINAKLIEELDVGIHLEEDDLPHLDLDNLKQRIENLYSRFRGYSLPCDGAREAAEFIETLINWPS
jgi:predicted glycosyltransferase